jgi:hypothetical protein
VDRPHIRKSRQSCHDRLFNFNKNISIVCKNNRDKSYISVLDPSKGVCADPVGRVAILEVKGPGPPVGVSERQLSPDRGGEKRDKMRRREVDDPFMASECDHAQSELTCIANKKKACKYPQ